MATRDTYTKVHEEWKDKPDKTTPVYADDLEHIEQGIKDASDKRALRDIYGDAQIDFGRKSGSYAGYQSIVLGTDCTASGWGSLAEGAGTSATGIYSHAEGYNTIAAGRYQHVSGELNVEDSNNQYAVIVGGGTSGSNRKNIHTLDWAGNGYFDGDVTNGANISLNSLKSDVDNLQSIAEGGAIAKVFDTKEDLDTWLAIEGNPDTLSVGQNIYIKAADTPDYWWDGTGLQVLETDKVVIESMTYDETMAILNAAAEEVA